MPIPPEILRRLSKTRSELDRARGAEAHRRAAATARERAEAEATRHAMGEAELRAQEIWRWLDTDGKTLAAELGRAGVEFVTLVANANDGYRGGLYLESDGTLVGDRRTGPAWGLRRAATSPAELAQLALPAVVFELADAIRDGSIWARVEQSLGDLARRAAEIAEPEADLDEE